MTGRLTRLRADDGPFDAWWEPAREARRGGLVILHAAWGVTPHLRALAAGWAVEGWEALIPALLDPPGSPLPLADADPARVAARSALANASRHGQATLPRIRAAVQALQGPVMVMGFGLGGTAAWLAACRLDALAAVAAFDGEDILRFADEAPRCPMVLHFGRRDTGIPPADREAIIAAHPDMPVHVYDAGHAFVAPDGYEADSARLALLRTRRLFHRATGGKEHGA